MTPCRWRCGRSWRRAGSRRSGASRAGGGQTPLLPVGRIPARALAGERLGQPRRRSGGRGPCGTRRAGARLRSASRWRNRSGLGNGGLGRLAACFLDSLATLQFPAIGYGIRYDYGIFTQSIDTDGRAARIAEQLAAPLQPLGDRARRMRAMSIRFGGRVLTHAGRPGRARATRWAETHDILGRRLRPAGPGQPQPTVNHLRLWSGCAIAAVPHRGFQLAAATSAPSTAQVDAKNLSRLLYPDDCTPQGKELRLKQQYFFVSAEHPGHPRASTSPTAGARGSARRARDPAQRHASDARDRRADAAARRRARARLEALPGRSPGGSSRHTNDTLLPEALEAWPVAFFERLLPRHLQIIYLINRALLDEVSARYPQDIRAAQPGYRLSRRTHGRRVRMAHLAVVGLHTSTASRTCTPSLCSAPSSAARRWSMACVLPDSTVLA